MTSSFVVVAGITGAIIGPTVLKFFRITSTIGKGVGMAAITYYRGKSSCEGRRERSDDRFGDDDCNRNTY